ncbi:MAG: DUF721 domain-containing protein [Spirochaetales bacterium]|nr:DUF721 domain-containing protein [Spirochaetales bacterium]
MKYYNRNFKNISSASDEVELLLSLISPQAADIYTVKKLDGAFRRALNELHLESLAKLAAVAAYKSQCVLILCAHPAVLMQLSFYKEEIGEHLRAAEIAVIREIFIKQKK